MLNRITSEFPNEKIGCFFADKKNFIIDELVKTNIIENDISEISRQSVRAIICDDISLFDYIVDTIKDSKKVFFIFHNINDLINYNKGLGDNFFCTVKSTSILNNVECVKDCITSESSCLLLSIQDSFISNSVNGKINDDNLIYIKNIIELLIFFEKNEEITVYNYNLFGKHLKKFLFISQSFRFSLVGYFKCIYLEMYGQSFNKEEISFLINCVFYRFIKNRLFVKLRSDCFLKRIQFHEKQLNTIFNKDLLIKSYFTYFELDNFLLKIKNDYVHILRISNRIFNLIGYIYKKNLWKYEKKEIEGDKLLKALSYASDFDTDGIACLMRNLGLLNVN